MKYEIIPVITLNKIEDNVGFPIKDLFWKHNFPTDTYKRLYFDRGETYTGISWQNENDIILRNHVRLYLSSLYPNYSSCIVDFVN